MITEQQMHDAFTQLFKSSRTRDLIESIVLKDEEGNYLLFGIYVIKKTGDIYEVSIGSTVKNTFSTLRTAVVWATMDKRNKILDAEQVSILDKNLYSAEFNIELHKKLYKKTKDVDMKVIYLNKLQKDMSNKKSLTQELDRFARNVQLWQLKKFQEQTSK
jgi:hypothetical protein